MASRGLLELPTELLENVAVAVAEKDLLSLRFVCRETQQKTQKVLKKRIFETFEVHLEEKALRAAVAIATHPVFGPAIGNTLRICIEGLDRNGSGHTAPESISESRGELHALDDLFECLEKLGKVTKVHIMDRCHRSRHIRMTLKDIQVPHGAFSRSCYSTPFAVVMIAMKESNLNIEELAICGPRAIELNTYHPTLHPLPIGLTTLSLRLKWSALDATHGGYDFFPKVASLPYLTTLSIAGPPSGGIEIITGETIKFVLRQHYQRLTSLSLSGGDAWYSDVLAFVRRQASGMPLRQFRIQCQSFWFDDQEDRDRYPSDLVSGLKEIAPHIGISVHYVDIALVHVEPSELSDDEENNSDSGSSQII